MIIFWIYLKQNILLKFISLVPFYFFNVTTIKCVITHMAGLVLLLDMPLVLLEVCRL